VAKENRFIGKHLADLAHKLRADAIFSIGFFREDVVNAKNMIERLDTNKSHDFVGYVFMTRDDALRLI